MTLLKNANQLFKFLAKTSSIQLLLLAMVILTAAGRNFMNSRLIAEETVLENAENKVNKVTDKSKKIYRNAKDKTCEILNGKTHCIVKKIENKINNASDTAKTDVSDIKNKVD